MKKTKLKNRKAQEKYSNGMEENPAIEHFVSMFINGKQIMVKNGYIIDKFKNIQK